MVHRSVDTPHYHIWTDALHGRHLAKRTKNDWDRGTYVRWTIFSAWIAFELEVGDTLNIQRIAHRPFDQIEDALWNRGLQHLDRGRGIWQQVVALHDRRNDFMHQAGNQQRLFAPTADGADHAITTVRDAVMDIHKRLGTTHPEWIEDDANPESPDGVTGALTVAGADPNDPETIRILLVFRGDEKVSDYLPPGTNPTPTMEKLIKNVLVPISAVRAYKGDELIEEIEITMRGT